ncbi:MAG: helix-turn-helix transcriptional regulator [Geminicoccaceae bacterium]|nr:helix-turn-helix transcriptional regulator [Geminicoccaceae bacterium]
MSTPPEPDQSRLRARLLERLRPLAAHDRRQAGIHVHGPQLFSYCALATERLTRARLAHPAIGIVLSGNKEVWMGDSGQRLLPGEVFVFPGSLDLDVVNVPDDRAGLYESLLLEVSALPASLAGAGTDAPPGFDIKLPLTPDLVDALGHAAITLAASDHAEALAEHRLAEVLLLLKNMPAAKPLFAAGLADRVTWMVLNAPAHDWTAAEIAAKLGVGASTLRRRFAREGRSLRRIVREARMRLAREMLRAGNGTVTQAAEAVGYASRSHFAHRFKSAYGVPPSRSRDGAAG